MHNNSLTSSAKQIIIIDNNIYNNIYNNNNNNNNKIIPCIYYIKEKELEKKNERIVISALALQPCLSRFCNFKGSWSLTFLQNPAKLKIYDL